MLTESERRVLKVLVDLGGEIPVGEVSRRAGVPLSTVMAALEGLVEKGLVERRVVRTYKAKLTEEGLTYARRGMPERRIASLVASSGGRMAIADLARSGLSKSEVSIGLGWVVRKSWGRVHAGVVEIPEEPPIGDDERLLRVLYKAGGVVEVSEEASLKTLKVLERRGLVELVVEEEVLVKPTPRAVSVLRELKPMAVKLTPEMLRTGAWRSVSFKPYNVKALPPRVYPGRKHFYLEFLDMIRRVLVAMGFTEVEGPIVETEFWNFDVLFQAQDHPAREVHDTFRLSRPAYGRLEDEEIVRRVKEIHETGGATGSKGWGYRWDPRIAARLVLRSQTTSVTARYLASRPKPPVKVFTIGKVYRPDVIDATHLPEFHQLDGIVMDEGLSFKHLLGILKEFFKQLGIEEVRFKPSYFPFTEPSVEGYIYHPRAGWVEAFGAGMFRPEVLAALGVEYPVAAWGIGIDRVAMIFMGIDDIRKLYTTDVGFLRRVKVRW